MIKNIVTNLGSWTLFCFVLLNSISISTIFLFISKDILNSVLFQKNAESCMFPINKTTKVIVWLLKKKKKVIVWFPRHPP